MRLHKNKTPAKAAVIPNTGTGLEGLLDDGKGKGIEGLVSKDKIEFEGNSYWTDESIKAEVTYQSHSLTPLHP